MALLAALLLFAHLPEGLRHRTLRQRVATYLGLDLAASTPGRMTYDLRRPRLKGILWRIPHTQRYRVTPHGDKVAFLFTRLNARIFRPTFAALDPTEPIARPLADALAEVERQLAAIVDDAALQQVA